MFSLKELQNINHLSSSWYKNVNIEALIIININEYKQNYNKDNCLPFFCLSVSFSYSVFFFFLFREIIEKILKTNPL